MTISSIQLPVAECAIVSEGLPHFCSWQTLLFYLAMSSLLTGSNSSTAKAILLIVAGKSVFFRRCLPHQMLNKVIPLFPDKIFVGR